MINVSGREIADPDTVITGGERVQMGATWRRVDLHLHTPGVRSFSCPSGADLKSLKGRAEVVKQYVDQLEAIDVTQLNRSEQFAFWTKMGT